MATELPLTWRLRRWLIQKARLTAKRDYWKTIAESCLNSGESISGATIERIADLNGDIAALEKRIALSARKTVLVD
jgi:hypothetical protein